MTDQELRLHCLSQCAGDVGLAQQAYKWLSPVESESSRQLPGGSAVIRYCVEHKSVATEALEAIGSIFGGLSEPNRAYVLSRLIEAVLECEAARG